MKKLFGMLGSLAFAAVLLVSCTVPSVRPPQGDDGSRSGSVLRSQDEPSSGRPSSGNSASPSSDVTVPDADAEAEFVRVLDEMNYAFWASMQLPANEELRAMAINQNTFDYPNLLVVVAGWIKTGTVNYDAVTAEELLQASRDLFGVEINLDNAYSENGLYMIPGFGPMWTGELLPDTVRIEGDTYIVDTLIKYIEYETTEEEWDTTTLRHTFVRNPDGAAFPYRLLSILKVDSTLPLAMEGVMEPVNVYPMPMMGTITVDEAVVLRVPGDDTSMFSVWNRDDLVYVFGDDGGEWLFVEYGWVLASSVNILGAIA